MIQCPWCGTQYTAFQSNCSNCGGPLRAPAETAAALAGQGFDAELVFPPPPPRAIDNRYAWRLAGRDGWFMAAGVFALLGVIFTPLGGVLTIAIITAFVGLPFLLLGIVFLAAGGGGMYWRYQEAQKVADIVRRGEACRGQVVDLSENTAVEVNGRNPWTIRYEFEAAGQNIQGEVTTLSRPGMELQAGRPVCVLYLPEDPRRNSLYPRP